MLMQPYMTPVNFSFSWHRITDSTEPNNCSLVRCEQVCLGRSYSHEIRIRILNTSVVEHFSQNFHRVLLRCRVTDTTAWMPKWLTVNGPDSSSRFVLHYTVVLMPNSFQILLTKNIILFTKTINDYHYNDIPIAYFIKCCSSSCFQTTSMPLCPVYITAETELPCFTVTTQYPLSNVALWFIAEFINLALLLIN